MTIDIASQLLKELLTPQIAGIALALFIIAEVIKRTERVDKRLIPAILLALAVGLGPTVLGGYTPLAIVQSIWALGIEMIGYQVGDNTTDLIRHMEAKDE